MILTQGKNMITERPFEETFEVKENLTIRIKRKTSDESLTQKFKFIPILNSAFSNLGFDDDAFFLPKLYAALVCLTGPSDSRYDDYKGSYSFTFLLKVQKNDGNSKYIYHLYHYRSYIDFSIYQIVNKDDPRDKSNLYKPDDELFSDRDICYFSNYFCGYCLSYIEGVKYIPQPFIKNSDSNLLLFGYFNSEYFCESFDDGGVYHTEKNRLREQILSTLPHDPFLD